MQRWVTNKDKETPTIFQITDPDKDPLTRSWAHNSERTASNGVTSVEHRRRRRQRHGGVRNNVKNPNDGKNDTSGKKDKNGMDGRKGTNEYIFLELPKSLC